MDLSHKQHDSSFLERFREIDGSDEEEMCASKNNWSRIYSLGMMYALDFFLSSSFILSLLLLWPCVCLYVYACVYVSASVCLCLCLYLCFCVCVSSSIDPTQPVKHLPV